MLIIINSIRLISFSLITHSKFIWAEKYHSFDRISYLEWWNSFLNLFHFHWLGQSGINFSFYQFLISILYKINLEIRNPSHLIIWPNSLPLVSTIEKSLTIALSNRGQLATSQVFKVIFRYFWCNKHEQYVEKYIPSWEI